MLYTHYRRYRTGIGTNGVEEELPPGEFRKTEAGLHGQSQFMHDEAMHWINRWNSSVSLSMWRYSLADPVRDEEL